LRSHLSVRELLNRAVLLLEGRVERPRLEAEILLSFFLKKDRLWLFSHDDETIRNCEDFLNLVKKRALNYPLEYITQKASFYSREFFVKEGVLIPRPETELLVDESLKILKNISNAKVAEIGVGSGIVSVMLALLKDDLEIIATDISQKALEVAYENAKRFEVADRIEFVKSSFLDNIEDDFDMIVSNPPYIANDFKLEENVLREPKEALFGGEKGDEILKRIIDLSIDRGVRYLVCEMGYDQKNSIDEYLKSRGIKKRGFYKDLSGLDRGFWARVEVERLDDKTNKRL